MLASTVHKLFLYGLINDNQTPNTKTTSFNMKKTSIKDFTGLINNEIIDKIFQSYGLSQYHFSFRIYVEDYDYQLHRENNQYIRTPAIDIFPVFTDYTMRKLCKMIAPDEYYFKADLDYTKQILVTRLQ